MRLSVVMITRNEARNLTRLLPELVDWVDEIIIYDNSDVERAESALLAQQYCAKFYPCMLAWAGFGVQRQRAQVLATGDWILALDADEIPDATLKQAIRAVVENPAETRVFGLRTLDYFGAHRIDSPRARIKAHWRLYRKTLGFDDALVHESVRLQGARTAVLEGYVHHYTSPTIAFWLEKRLRYARAWAQDRQGQKRFGIGKILKHSIGAFFKQYLVDKRFLCGRWGFFYACLFAQYTFNKYAILYDRQQHPERYPSLALDTTISHDFPPTQSNLEAWIVAQQQSALTSPQTLAWYALPWETFKRFVAVYVGKGGFRRGRYGLLYAIIAAHHRFNQLLGGLPC